MIYDELKRSVWNGGQLMAFSALDGTTDYNGALTARTAFDAPKIDITLPARGCIRFPGMTHADSVVAGDWFRLGNENPAWGVLLDTHHLLVAGHCVVSHAEPGIACTTDGNRTLIGSSSHFDPGKIATDIAAAVQARRRWLESLRLPAVKRCAARRTLVKALSVMKTQVYSPEGRIRHRWTTPDRWPHRQMWLMWILPTPQIKTSPNRRSCMNKADRTYDVATYIWPAYTGDEPRTRIVAGASSSGNRKWLKKITGAGYSGHPEI